MQTTPCLILYPSVTSKNLSSHGVKSTANCTILDFRHWPPSCSVCPAVWRRHKPRISKFPDLILSSTTTTQDPLLDTKTDYRCHFYLPPIPLSLSLVWSRSLCSIFFLSHLEAHPNLPIPLPPWFRLTGVKFGSWVLGIYTFFRTLSFLWDKWWYRSHRFSYPVSSMGTMYHDDDHLRTVYQQLAYWWTIVVDLSKGPSHRNTHPEVSFVSGVPEEHGSRGWDPWDFSYYLVTLMFRSPKWTERRRI